MLSRVDASELARHPFSRQEKYKEPVEVLWIRANRSMMQWYVIIGFYR